MFSSRPYRKPVAVTSTLDELLGTEPAETLMAYLPAYENTELATKEDIWRLDDRFDRIED
jgi:hypothetical protein